MKTSANALCLFLFLVVALSGCSGHGSDAPLAAFPKPASNTPVLAVSAVAGDGRVTLGWSSVANATRYAVYSSNSATQAGSMIASVPAPSTAYEHTAVLNGITYYYTIEALYGATVIGRSGVVSATPGALPAFVTISGTMQYQDKEYDSGGFTGNQPSKAIRYASVDLVSGNSVLLSTQTDSAGFYRFTTAPTLTVYVRVQAAATPPGSPAGIEVNNLAGSLYAVRGNSFTASGNADVTLTVPSSSIGGVFNILDVFTSSFEFVHAMSSYPSVTLAAFWQKNNSSGTYYCSETGTGCPRGKGIYVSNSPTDTDEYDDDVLYHEFGHFAAALFSRDESPGGTHMLTSNDLDLRLAWSEGWGDSMPGNIKRWLYSADPGLISATGAYPDFLTEYVDTTAYGVGISLDMANPGGSPYLYASGEIAIAKILLDLNLDYGIQNVWDVVADFRNNPPSTPVNLELFWDRWHSLPGTSTKPIDSYFTARQIYYADDSLEPDNDFTSASMYSGLQVHYLYNNADYVAFPVTRGRSYSVTTSMIRNGADTRITVYRSDPAIFVGANDNANSDAYSGSLVPSDLNAWLITSYGIRRDNGSDILGSALSFIAPTTDTYYVKVESSPNRPVSAGRYGTYTLSITSP